MSQSQPPRELMYCHLCENEWFRDQHGIICPACQSEFTEVIETSHDPRDERPSPLRTDSGPVTRSHSQADQHPLHNHNPWRNENPDDAGGVRWEQIGPGTHRVSSTFVRQFPPSPNHQPDRQDPFAGLLGSFQSMVQQITQNQQRETQTMTTPSGARVSFQTRTGNFGPFGFYATTARLAPRDPNHSSNQQSPIDETDRQGAPFNHEAEFPPLTLDDRMRTNPFFADLHRGSNMGGFSEFDDHFARLHNDMPPHPIFGLLSTLLNPAGAQHGDAVYTQEALDRVISQLMEQNAMGSAPGPTPAQELSQLPMVQVSKEMLDSDGNATCSICMDNVELGDEVTRLWCSHWFHEACVGAWLREHDSCPQCRKGVAEARDEVQGRPQHAAQQSGTSTTRAPGLSGMVGRMQSPDRTMAENMSAPQPPPGSRTLFSGFQETRADRDRDRARHGRASQRPSAGSGSGDPRRGSSGAGSARRSSGASSKRSGSGSGSGSGGSVSRRRAEADTRRPQSRDDQPGFAERVRNIFSRSAGPTANASGSGRS